MQRKPGPGFPVVNSSIKLPDGMPPDPMAPEDEGDHTHKRQQQLINFGHVQWGFKNWSWSVTKQDLDFVDFSNGKYCAGVVAFVSVSVKSFDIHRENIGYATSFALSKGAAIYKSRKCAVTNALRETLLSFGGNVANELMDLLESHKSEVPNPMPVPAPTLVTAPTPVAAPIVPSAPAVPTTPNIPQEPQNENNQNIPNKEPKNSTVNKNIRKDSADSGPIRSPHPAIKNAMPNVGNVPPIAKAHPMPVLPPANRPPLPANVRPPPPPPQPPHMRPNSNDRPLESMTEEEARAERRRRQQRAQEEFRKKHKQEYDEKPDMPRPSASSTASFDHLLMEIPTQDIEIEQTGEDAGKRKSPPQEGSAKKRAVMRRLDVVTTD